MEKIKKIAHEANARLKSPTPPFFKRIVKYSKYIAWGSGVIAAGVASIMTAGIAVPAFVPIVLGAITAMSATAAGTASLATEDPSVAGMQYDNSASNTSQSNNK